MTTVPRCHGKDRLCKHLNEVDRTHDRVTTARGGKLPVVVIGSDNLAVLEETIASLTTTEGTAEGLADLEANTATDNEAS